MNLHDTPIFNLKQEGLQNVSPHYCLKRTSSHDKQSAKYETIKKITHLNEENDSIYLVKTYKKKHFPAEPVSYEKNQEEIYYEDQISATPLRQKYAQLIPDYEGAKYNNEQKMLMRAQSKLDQHLLYLKVHRGKKKGQFFKSSGIIIEMANIKQILFIDNSLYIASRQKNKNFSNDILIDLPQDADLVSRKKIFRQKLYLYLKSVNAFQGKNNITIPTFQFPFEERILSHNQNIIVKRQEEQLYNLQEQAKQQPEKLTVKNLFNPSFNFAEKLKQRINQKKMKIQEKQRNSTAEKKYGNAEVLKVLDEIHLAYSYKKISNMFWATLVELISKKLLILDNIVAEIIKVIVDNQYGYLKQIQHSKGIILQMDRKLYGQTRQKIMNMRFDKL